MEERARAVAITGAAGHLGQAVARAFLAGGWSVIAVGRSVERLKALPDDARLIKLAVDFDDDAQAGAVFGEAADKLGGIDALCCIAGAFEMGEGAHEITRESFARMMDANAGSMLAAVHAVAPGMIARGSGAIVTVGAAAALRGGAKMGAYAAAKSAVMRLTESMAAELGSKGIRVNGILPEIIDTPDNRAAMPKSNRKGWASPDEIAKLIRFLCSVDAAAVNGALIPVSGR